MTNVDLDTTIKEINDLQRSSNIVYNKVIKVKNYKKLVKVFKDHIHINGLPYVQS